MGDVAAQTARYRWIRFGSYLFKRVSADRAIGAGTSI